MSLFQSLFPLARENALTVLIVAEGDQLRVNVMPKSKDEKAAKTLYPLSLLGAPDELDRDFAEAVSIYSPGSQSVLEQARAASAANGATPALPAPAKGKPGRKPKAAALPAPATTQADASPDAEGGDEPKANDDGTPEVDPRQDRIPGLDDVEDSGATTAQAAEDSQAASVPADENAAADSADDDGAVDIL